MAASKTQAPTERKSYIVTPRRYVLCPAAPYAHPPYSLPVYRGPKSFHAKCGTCKTQLFLSPAWSAEMGFTQEDLQAMGIAWAVA